MTEKVHKIQQHMKTAQSGQKSYVDNRRWDLEFVVGDHIFLKVSPWKGVMRFGRNGNLILRYIRPYEIIQIVRAISYKL